MFSILLGETWAGISSEVIKNGFAKAGIHRFNSSVIAETHYDPAALLRWKKSQEPLTPGAHVQVETPEAHVQVEAPGARVEVPIVQVQGGREESRQSNPNDTSALPDTPPISFETLLLNTAKQSTLPKPTKKTRVAPGAEGITTEKVLSRLLENQATPQKKPRVQTKNAGLQNKRQLAKTTPVHTPNRRKKTPAGTSRSENSNPVENSLAEGKWVLVKYASKRSILHHYCGLIVSKNHNPSQGDWNIKFLKFKGGHFTWPDIDDVDTVSETDVLKILAAPTVGRHGNSLTFAEKLTGFHIY
jgi:hypothetical protein